MVAPQLCPGVGRCPATPLANNRFQGALIWEPRPWWQLLLVILTLFGTLVGIALLVWWLLTRPPARAEIISFAPATYTLKEADGRPIELNWTIKILRNSSSFN